MAGLIKVTVSCMEFKMTYPPQYQILSYTHQIFGSFWEFWGGSAELMQTLPGMYPFLPLYSIEYVHPTIAIFEFGPKTR